MPTINVVLREASVTLAGIESGRLDAEILLAHIMSVPRSYFYTWPGKSLDASQYNQFLCLLKRRTEHYPVAYLIGRREFWSLDFLVNESVLIPRPETEVLVESALQLAEHSGLLNLAIMDMGTGSGAVACSLAHELPDCAFLAVDESQKALVVAKKNAQLLNLKNISFVQANWFQGLKGVFDMIVSNPPYIDESDHHLLEGDVRYEPTSALVAGDNGMGDISQICKNAPDYLRPGGWLLLEHGWQQAVLVRKLLAEYGFMDIASHRDIAGHERVTLGRKPGLWA